MGMLSITQSTVSKGHMFAVVGGAGLRYGVDKGQHGRGEWRKEGGKESGGRGCVAATVEAVQVLALWEHLSFLPASPPKLSSTRIPATPERVIIRRPSTCAFTSQVLPAARTTVYLCACCLRLLIAAARLDFASPPSTSAPLPRRAPLNSIPRPQNRP